MPAQLARLAGFATRRPQIPSLWAGGPGFDTRSGHELSFLLPPIQEGQLSVTGENMCTKYWLTA